MPERVVAEGVPDCVTATIGPIRKGKLSQNGASETFAERAL